MNQVHRHGDSRACGATTIVEGQNSVFVGGELWAVRGDPNSHGEGRLENTTGSSIFINGKEIIVHGPDLTINGDNLGHSAPNSPRTASGFGTMSAY